MASKIRYSPENTYFTVNADMIRICDGDWQAAAVLELLLKLNRHEEVYVKASINEIRSFLLGVPSRNNVISSISSLVKLGFIKRAGKNGFHDQPIEIKEILIQERIDRKTSPKQDGYQSQIGPDKDPHPSWLGSVPVLVGIGTRPSWDMTYKEEKEVEISMKEENCVFHVNNSESKNSPTPIQGSDEQSLAQARSRAVKGVKIKSGSILAFPENPAILPSIDLHGLESGNMNITVIQSTLAEYIKIPSRNRREKGSLGQIFKKFGDRLAGPAEDVGEELVEAMKNYIQDEFWITKELPIEGFLKQYTRFLPKSEGQGLPQRKSGPFDRREEESAGANVAPLAVFQGLDDSGAIRRKREALDALGRSGDPVFDDCVAEIGCKIDVSMYDRIEHWHQYALKAYYQKYKQNYPVITEPIKKVA